MAASLVPVARADPETKTCDELVQQAELFSLEPPQEEVPSQPISIQDYIDPGAGLKQLQDVFPDSDFIFDSLFMGMPEEASGDSTSEASLGFASLTVPMVRTYRNDRDILDAYYLFLHQYLPILPPPTAVPIDQPVPYFQNSAEAFETGFEPSTPITLAICAILALIPCANDINPTSHDAAVFRRKYAQYLAQSAIEAIEMEAEIPESSIEPPKALNGSPNQDSRAPFHPGLPMEYECIVALDILSVYEYAQRGNLKKMQRRAGQALVAAMELSLHNSTIEDEFTEVRRRIWWMTYVCVSQGAIVNNSDPSFAVFAHTFTTKYPTLKCDPDAFPLMIQSQQAILAASQFASDLKKALVANVDMAPIYERMKKLESYLEPLTAQADGWLLQASTTSPLDPARIKCHRYSAFSDVALFTTQHCDLRAKSEETDATPELRQWPSSSSTGSISPPRSSPRSSDSGGHGCAAAGGVFPFTSHQSAKICLKAALNVARSFDDLPYPNAAGQLCLPPSTLSPTSSLVAPRTMPSFACCAMQCAYALLMVHGKTRAMYPEPGMGGPMVESLLVRLQTGLRSISGTLENYATAFEALGGMRDTIRSVMEPANVFT
ncbi:hypothetical protein HYQ45_015289 [Verticillium longisporum]|uniref:Transcription factor domain-containing protein n=1 Tax=Verticillium longisporum TaxID=100787 RepID=A0A8I2Z6W2_VERLO|nr:hypothetical protein HYQ45_015289 [Verticillium longisporum]